MLRHFAIVWFRFPYVANLFFWIEFLSALMLPVEMRIFPDGGNDANPRKCSTTTSLALLLPLTSLSVSPRSIFRQFFMTLPRMKL